jgi:MFS transporter, ACS family, tartrate transporter
MSQSATTIASVTGTKSELETSTIRAISWRLIPFLVLAYFFSYLDRVNLGFAALTMNAELKFSPTIFAWGAGIFFIGYFIFEVPSNLALERFGASRWIARIMVTWGIISAMMALVSGVWSFYGLRNIARAFWPLLRSPSRSQPSSARRSPGCCWASTAPWA